VVRTDDLESLRDFGPFDVILDPVGGNYSALNLKLMALDGRWVLIGLMGGREATGSGAGVGQACATARFDVAQP